jgi:hypothetical protein
MLDIKKGHHTHGMRFVQSTTFVCLCLIFPIASALNALAQDGKPQSKAAVREEREGVTRSIDENLETMAPIALSSSKELPPLPTAATFIQWAVLENGYVYPSRCMALGRYRTRMEFSGLQISISGQGKSVTLNHGEKKAYITENAKENEIADFFGHLQRLLTDPQYSPEMKREMLGESEIDGRRAIGCRFVDDRRILTIWVEPDSLLPMQVEEVSWMFPKTRTIYANFVFNVDLDKLLFSLDPPADYTIIVRTVPKEPIPTAETDLIELFRQYRDNGQHTFPDTVDARAGHELLQIRKSKLGNRVTLTEKQRQEMLEFAEKLSRGPLFVAGLRTGANAHYAGKGVKVAATDTPIFWYRPEGKEKYRVIRTDLSVVELDSPPQIPGVQAIDEWEKDDLSSRNPWPNPGARYHERAFKEGVQAGGELKYVGNIPVLFLQGTPEEMGRQQGLLLADATRPLIDVPKGYVRAAGFDAAWPAIVLLSKVGLQRAPEQYRRELEAAAQAAALSEEERDALIVGNAMIEMKPFGGCSSLLVEPARSATGEMVFGRNLDGPQPRGVDRLGLVKIYRPVEKHAFASVGFPGLGGVLSGINDVGLALATHSVGASRENEPAFNPLGTPLYCTFRRILEECSSVKEAEELLRKSEGYTKSILLAACDTERATVFEITTKKIVTRDPEDHLLICTNHYRSPALCLSKDCPRYEALARLRQQDALLTCSDVAEAMRLVGNGNTTQSMIFEPKSLHLRVALGFLPLWEGPFAEIDLATLFRHKVAK